MSVTAATYIARLQVTETPNLGVAQVTNLLHTHALKANLTLDGSTTVPATQVYSATLNLSCGTLTVDLASLTDLAGSALDLTGLKVQLLLIIAASDNTAAIVVKDHGTNGYDIFGDASGSVAIPIGGFVMYGGNDKLDDVAAADKQVLVTSGDADAGFQIMIVAG